MILDHMRSLLLLAVLLISACSHGQENAAVAAAPAKAACEVEARAPLLAPLDADVTADKFTVDGGVWTVEGTVTNGDQTVGYRCVVEDNTPVWSIVDWTYTD